LFTPSWFFISVADEGHSVTVSGLESTVVGGYISKCGSVDILGTVLVVRDRQGEAYGVF
jgi:hypothetical protein